MPEHLNRPNGASSQNGAVKCTSVAQRFRAASLFSGIGGFDLGLERARFEITFQCELDKFCRCILRHRWPEIPLHENIKELHANDIPPSDVWAGGFPCQDVSLARMGKRAGLRGKRSGLFYDFARLVGEARPRVAHWRIALVLCPTNTRKNLCRPCRGFAAKNAVTGSLRPRLISGNPSGIQGRRSAQSAQDVP